MTPPPDKKPPSEGKKVRVALRRNRSKPPREKDWTQQARESGGDDFDSQRSESVVAKGDLSRRRTVIVHQDGEAARADLHSGVVIAMRGLYADVDDGQRVWACTVRRMLRTRHIEERHPVAVGDRVGFTVQTSGDAGENEGAIESVEQRRGQLRRRSGKRTQTIAANVDQAIIVSSAAEPHPKPQLIDRYIVAASADGITPFVCMNKIDLDHEGEARELLGFYATLGYGALCTSIHTGEGVEALRDLLKNKCSVVAGQSGVGKSSLLNVVQPGLNLMVAEVGRHNDKGRHTTTTARLIRLGVGGYVVDTPGIRSLDLSLVERNEYEAYFAEFMPFIPNCKFPDCTHSHEGDCAVKAAVERGDIHPRRYESYLHLFLEPGEAPI